MKFRKINNIFFVGIGGIGMSGIAELLHNLSFSISGSDMNENDILISIGKHLELCKSNRKPVCLLVRKGTFKIILYTINLKF